MQAQGNQARLGQPIPVIYGRQSRAEMARLHEAVAAEIQRAKPSQPRPSPTEPEGKITETGLDKLRKELERVEKFSRSQIREQTEAAGEEAQRYNEHMRKANEHTRKAIELLDARAKPFRGGKK